jgi:hypothetical protein
MPDVPDMTPRDLGFIELAGKSETLRVFGISSTPSGSKG